MAYFFFDALLSNNILFRVKSAFIFSTDQSAISLFFKPWIWHELIVDCSIYLTVLNMIGQSKMNERLLDMTPNRMLSILVYWKEKYKINLSSFKLLVFFNYTNVAFLALYWILKLEKNKSCFKGHHTVVFIIIIPQSLHVL
jgi:hypothetical protein